MERSICTTPTLCLTSKKEFHQDGSKNRSSARSSPHNEKPTGVLMKWLQAAAAIACLVPGLALQGAQVDALTIARATDDHYNHIRTLKAEFTENYDGGGITRSESGSLWLKKPGRMRWDYAQPRKKLFLVDAKSAVFYVPGERQARRTSVKQLDDI